MSIYKFKPKVSLGLGLFAWLFLLVFQLTLVIIGKNLTTYLYYFIYHIVLGLSIISIHNYYDQKLKIAKPETILKFLNKTFKYAILSIIPVLVIWVFLFTLLSGSYITRNASVLNLVNHFNIGLTLTFLIIIFTIWKRFILFDDDTSFAKSLWKIFEYLLLVTFLFDFISILLPTSFYYFIGASVSLYGLILSFNLKWIAYISFDKKWKSILYLSFIIISLVFYFQIFLQTNLLGIIIFDLTKSLYFGVLGLFVFVYSFISILVNIFNLPTSSVFEKFQKEKQIARKVQESLIPKDLPYSNQLKIFSIYKPHSDLGGDYFDYIPINKSKFLICIGDVSGKGMPAALLMSNFQATLRTILRYTDNLKDIVNELNFQLKSKESGDRFISFFIAICDLKDHEVKYINCGHPAPLFKFNNKIILLDKGTTLLGILDKLPNLQTHTISFTKEYLLLCYTDGLLETQNEQQNYYGIERLKKFILNKNDNFDKLHNFILSDLTSFKGQNVFNDDITILTIKFNNGKI